MTRSPRLLPALAAAVVLALAPAALGDSAVAGGVIADDAVARVGDASITRATFKHWLRIEATRFNGAPEPTYVPPRFARCIATKRAERERSRGTSRLRRECRTEYEILLDEAMSNLILEKWVASETAELGIRISPEQLEKDFRQWVRETFGGESRLLRYLRAEGMTLADARFQEASHSRYAKLVEHRTVPLTPPDLEAYYHDHLTTFNRPPTRDVRLVLARTHARAAAARRGLERGQTWRHVARKYSIDGVSRLGGGLLRGMVQASQRKHLGAALFGAPPGELRGPVEVEYGFLVFKVVTVNPGGQMTLAQATPEITVEVAREHAAEAQERLEQDVRAKWRPRTRCRAGFVVTMCGNASGGDPG